MTRFRPQRVLKRSGKQATGHATYGIGIPWQIAEVLPDGLEFAPELVDDGILFRPRFPEPEAPLVDPPAWVRNAGSQA